MQLKTNLMQLKTILMHLKTKWMQLNIDGVLRSSLLNHSIERSFIYMMSSLWVARLCVVPQMNPLSTETVNAWVRTISVVFDLYRHHRHNKGTTTTLQCVFKLRCLYNSPPNKSMASRLWPSYAVASSSSSSYPSASSSSVSASPFFRVLMCGRLLISLIRLCCARPFMFHLLSSLIIPKLFLISVFTSSSSELSSLSSIILHLSLFRIPFLHIHLLYCLLFILGLRGFFLYILLLSYFVSLFMCVLLACLCFARELS